VIGIARNALGELVSHQVPVVARTRCVATRPSWLELLEQAQAALANGDTLAALQALDQAEAMAGPHPLSQHVRGNACFALERYAEAAQAYEAALARRPDLAEAAANAAAVWLRLGQPEKALARAEHMLRLRPDHLPSLRHRVTALRSLGREAEALAAARAAQSEFPGAELE
jgi:tetratricopeptide (TPR) repeat protein